MSDSIRPYQNYTGGLVPQAVLNGTINTIVYASNYNDLDNKPSINSVELRGNKTASDLGLATPEDITVTSVNTQTGDVSLTGQNIPYDSSLSVTEKINDLESQIVDSGVTSVNGLTGVVNLTGNNIPYTVGKSVNTKINEVESSIPIVDYPVTSVNTKTGAVVLSGSDIEYSAGVSITTQINNVAGEISDLTGADIPLTSEDSTKVSEAIGPLSTLTTTDKSSLVGAVNSLVGWVDATAEFTKGSAFDTTQSSYILYNDALKMYAVSFAVKANSADNAVIFSSVPQLKNDIIVLPTGFANAGGLSVTQANVIYYKANNNIVLRISTTTSVPVFVTAFLLKA